MYEIRACREFESMNVSLTRVFDDPPVCECQRKEQESTQCGCPVGRRKLQLPTDVKKNVFPLISVPHDTWTLHISIWGSNTVELYKGICWNLPNYKKKSLKTWRRMQAFQQQKALRAATSFCFFLVCEISLSLSLCVLLFVGLSFSVSAGARLLSCVSACVMRMSQWALLSSSL